MYNSICIILIYNYRMFIKVQKRCSINLSTESGMLYYSISNYVMYFVISIEPMDESNDENIHKIDTLNGIYKSTYLIKYIYM